jgi:urease accessory protein
MTILVENLPEQRSASGPVEYVSMSWHDRCKPRLRVTTEKGTELALALPRGTVISDGTLLYDSPERSVCAKASAEDLIVVPAPSPRIAATVAHHLGNWHRSLQVMDDGSIATEEDAPYVEWLERVGIAYERRKAAYHPDCRGDAH